MKITKYNRYPMSNMFMIIGLVIALLAVICGTSLYTKVENQNKESKDYKYDNEIVISFSSIDGNYLNLNEIAQCKDINTEITFFAMSVGEYTRIVNIAYEYNENPSYILMSGRLPSKEDIAQKKKIVNIGRNLKKDTYKRGDIEYIKFDGIEYEVIGYFGSDESDSLDSIIYFIYDCLDEYHKKSVSEQDTIYIRYGSNVNDVTEATNNIKENIPENIDYSIEDANFYDTGITNEHDKDMYFFMIYAFAMGICIIISELWIFERREEVAILKTLGFAVNKILLRLLVSIFGIMCVSLMTAFLILIIAKRYTDTIFISLSGISMVTAFMMLSSIAVLIVPMYKVKTISPAQCINARGSY